MYNFEEFLYRNRLSKTKFAEYLGVGNSFVTKLVNGTRNIPEEKLRKILANPEWDTSMLAEIKPGKSLGSTSEPNEMSRKVEKLERKKTFIPLLPFSAIAGWMTDNNGVQSFAGDAVSFSDFSNMGADCAIRVEGDSMRPRYNNGDILAIRILKSPSFFQWGKVYVLNTNQGCVIKKLFPDPDDEDKIICHSENFENYPDYKITKADVIDVAIVVGHAGIE